MQDTRSKFKVTGKPLSIGRKVGKVPGVYAPGTQNNMAGPAQSPTTGLTMVQSTMPSAPSSGSFAPVGSEDNPSPQINQSQMPTPGSGGTISTSSGLTRVVPPAMPMRPAGPVAALPTPAAPVAAPTTTNAQQTESANPLTGAGNQQPGATTSQVNPGVAMGFSRRGLGAPAGTDASPLTANKPAGGLYAGNFTKPTRQQMIEKHVRNLFGGSVDEQDDNY